MRVSRRLTHRFASCRPLATLVIALGAVATLVPGAAAAATRYSEHELREGTNPTLAQKVIGYDAWVRAAGRAPDILLLGSSRAVRLDPRVVRGITGARLYNGGISTAGARELRVLTSFADLRTPGELPHLVVMLDIEAFDNRRPTPRVVDYQRRIDAAYARCRRPADCRRAWQLHARRLVADAVTRQRGGRPMRQTQRDDGMLINDSLERLGARELAQLIERRIGLRIASYRAGGVDRIYPTPRASFDRQLAIANARGVTPTLVLTTMHPACVRRCGPAGWNARRREVRRMLAELQRTRDFRLVDLSYAASWDGTASDFYDEVHLRRAGATRVVQRLARLGLLEPR
jgi:hypothetical protein